MYVLMITLTAFAVGWKVCVPWAGFGDAGWVAVVTPTDRPNSVRNRCDNLITINFLVSRYCLHIFAVLEDRNILGYLDR